MKKVLNITLLIGLCAVVNGCGAALRVTRLNTIQVIDLSGRWNDTDTRLVSEEMIQDVLSSAWLSAFKEAHDKRKPVLIVGTILNKTHEHIEAEPFIKNIEKAIINKGEARIVTNSTFREKLRQEREGQEEFVSPETQKYFGRELGADFMLFGNINSIVDTAGQNKVIFYQVNLELADLETNELVWIGEKKIKKYIGKSSKTKKKHRSAVPST